MAQVMPWGGEYSLIAELSLPSYPFTLDDASLGVLGGNCYLDGRSHDDLTDRVLSIDISRGRHDQFQDFQSSTMAITLSNNDRELDPVNQSSRYWDPITGTSGVTIRRRVTLYYGTTAIFTGLITDIDIQYDPTSAPTTRSTVEISVADDFVVLANTYMDEFLPTSQLSGSRVNAILALPEVNYSGATSIDAGTVTCLDDPVAFGTRALDALQAVAATERGYLFMSGDGTLVFTDRVVGSPTVEKLFADDGTGTEYTSLSIVYGQENLFNRVICTPIDSVNPGIAENATSIATYGVSALSLNNLLFSDADAQDLAEYMLELYQIPSYRFDGMTVVFAGNQVSLTDQAEIVALDLGDTVRVVKSFSVGSPSQIYQNVTIEHVDHRITPLAHEITLKFSPASFSTFTETATGSGTASSVAIGLHISGRTAEGTGSAVTSDGATGLHIAPRSATGSGVGTSTATGVNATTKRTATGSGTGTSSASGSRVIQKTVTGNGAGSATSSETVTFVMILNDSTRGVLAGYTTTTTRTNLLPDPNMENASIATYWQAIKITESRSTDFVYSGTYAMKGVVDTGTAGQYFQVLQTAGAMIDVVAGQAYTFSAYIYLPATNTADTSWRANLFFWNGTSYTGANAGATVTVTRGNWTRLTTTATVPAGYYKALPRIAAISTLAVGQEAYVDAWLLETGSTLLPYFDGSNSDTYTGYTLTSQQWNGTADASTSTATWGLNSSYITGSTLGY